MLKLTRYRLNIVFALGLIALVPFPGMAQIRPDDTLGNERSQVNRNVQVRGGNADRIEGGATRGANLFHSFREFNVNEGQRVYFANPSGITNILGRVTGRDVSDIMGTLGVDGGANLFLLNPNGVIFGPNARLDISGSFVSSTANSFTFPDGTEFSATNPGNSSLLSVSVPLGVQYGPGQRGDITNTGNLAVNSGQGITLYGGTVRSSGSLTAPSGTVQVLGDRVALTDNARIDVSGETGGGTVLVGGDYRGQGTVPSALRTFVGPNVTINADALSNGNGGRVIVWADEATGFYGTLTARGGTNAGNGGFAEVSSPISLDFAGRADLSARQGQFGTLLLDPRNITVVAGTNNPSDLPSGGGDELLFGDNPGGDNTVNNGTIDAQQTNVTLQATNNIIFNAPVNLSTDGVGLTVEAGNNIEVNQSILTTNGVINLTANTDNSIAVPERGSLAINANVSSTGGEISLTADSIIVKPSPGDSAVVQTSQTSQTSDESEVSSGNLNINTKELHILDGGQVSVDTFGSLSAGSINIQNADLVEVSGIGTNSQGEPVSSTLSVQVQDRPGATGDGGNLTIDTKTLRISNGGLVTASTFSSGKAGNIEIQNADLVEVAGIATDSTGEVVRNSEGELISSILRTQVEDRREARGEGGNLTINTKTLRISNRGLVTASTFSSGDAGDIEIQNADLVEVAGQNSALRAQVEDRRGATGEGGNLTINTKTLRISNGGLVTASTFSSGKAGDIEIQNADLVEVAGENSTLRTQVEDRKREQIGNGGKLTIDTKTLRISNGGLVTASTFSLGDAGDIEIQNADLVEVAGENSALRAQVEDRPGATGEGGDLTINTKTLRISNGGLVTASTFSSGKAGNIEIKNADLVEVAGENSALRAQVEDRPGATGEGGNLTINTKTLRISNGGLVTASTFSSGNAGNVNVNANNSVRLNNEGRLSAESLGDGQAGSLNLTTDQLLLQNESRITVSNDNGVAGSLIISADSVTLENSRLEARANADRRTEGEVGNVILTVSGTLLRLQNDSEGDMSENGFISAQALGGADGGNVTLNVRDGFVLASPYDNTDILASAIGGDGGRININTFAILGLEERDPPTLLSDINASSEFGRDGEILRDILGVDPTRGLSELPIDIVDAADLVAEGCIGSNRSGDEPQGEFTRTGRGGLSPDPTGILRDESLIDLSTPTDTDDQSGAVPSTPSEKPSQPLVEAQGLARNAKGQVSLVTYSTNPTVPSPRFRPNTCDAP